MEVRNSKFSAFLDMFTPHTYLCVIMPEAYFSTELMKININAARKHFVALENSGADGANGSTTAAVSSGNGSRHR